jgi:hypothetical protein
VTQLGCACNHVEHSNALLREGRLERRPYPFFAVFLHRTQQFGRHPGRFPLAMGSDCSRYLLTVLRLMPSSRATRRMLAPSRKTLSRITCT